MWIIDIHSCTDIRVTKVFRYIEQRDVLIDKDAGEGMPQVVKADIPHPVLLQQLREVRGDIAWLDQLTQGVDTDHVKVFFAVGSAELFAV